MSRSSESTVGGLTCSQVLELLSEFVDGELGAEQRERVEQHLRGCDACGRFGSEFEALVELLRGHLARSVRLPDGFRERLRKVFWEAD